MCGASSRGTCCWAWSCGWRGAGSRPSFTTWRSRWAPATGPEPAWLAVVGALIIGSATHVLWDTLTHAGQLTSLIAPLDAIYPGPLGPHHGYSYLQYASGALGLAILFWVGLRQPVATSQPRRQPRTAAIAPALVLASALCAVGIRVATMYDPSDRRALVFATVTSSISGAAVGVIAVCVAHAVVDLRAGRQAA